MLRNCVDKMGGQYNAVIKIDVNDKEEDQIYEALKLLLDDPQKGLDIGNASYTYAKENLDIEKVAKAYQNFIEGIVNKRYHLESLVVPVSKLLAELYLENNEQLMKECASVFPIYNRCQTSIFSS